MLDALQREAVAVDESGRPLEGSCVFGIPLAMEWCCERDESDLRKEYWHFLRGGKTELLFFGDLSRAVSFRGA